VDHLQDMGVELQVAVDLPQDMVEAHQGVVGHRPAMEVAEPRVGLV